MAPTQKKIGLIGLSAKGSWASRSHLHYLRDTPHYKISALQNSSKASAEAAAKEYSLSVSTHDNPTSLADDPNVDIVAVSVNVPEHYDLIKPALEAGKDIFVEWPLARNQADAEELTNLAKQKGIKTMVGLQARQNPAIVKAKEIVQSGNLGKILNTNMYGHGLISGGAVIQSFLYGLPIEAGANLLTIPFGHAVDALCYVLSEIKELSATLVNHDPEVPVLDANMKPTGETAKKTAHDHVSMIGTMVNGGAVSVTYAGGLSRTGRDFQWEIVGTEGSLLLVLEGPKMGGHVQMYQPSLKMALGPNGPLEEVQVEKTGVDFSFNVGRAWDAWAGEGLEKGYSVTTFEDAVVRHKMIEAIYRSAEKGTRETYL